jgi:hypothetical protein
MVSFYGNGIGEVFSHVNLKNICGQLEYVQPILVRMEYSLFSGIK